MMRIKELMAVFTFCLLGACAMAQSVDVASPSAGIEKYHKFVLYVGAGPNFFFNNLVASKDEVKPFKYAFSARLMWEPQHSKLSLGFETGYYRLYTVSSDKPKGDVANSSVPLMFVVSMKFSPKFYASWSMGQSILFSKVSNTDSSYNFNSHTWSLSDFAGTIGYRFIDKPKISYAAEIKGYYSSSYENFSIAALFIVGFKL